MDLIPKEFELERMGDHDDEALFQIILDRVNEMLENDVDLLMSYLYRLDVEENKINNALALDAVLPANEGIARLILDRQKLRLETKRKYKQKPIEGWDY